MERGSNHLGGNAICEVPNCTHTFAGEEVAFEIVVSQKILATESETPSEKNWISRLAHHSDSDGNDGDIPYYNVWEKTLLEPHDLKSLRFCRFHAPLCAGSIEEAGKTKEEIYSDSSQLEDALWNVLAEYSDSITVLKTRLELADARDRRNLVGQLRDLNLRNIVVPGDLRLQGQDFHNEVSRTVSFKGSHFYGELDIERSQFSGLDFSDCRFHSRLKASHIQSHRGSGINFQSSRFAGEVTFRGSTLNGNSINFADSEFRKRVDFESVNFENTANFERALFLGNGVFQDTRFAYQAIFSESQFCEVADFHRAWFLDSALFGGKLGKQKTYLKNGMFRGARFDRGGRFNHTQFGEARFLDAYVAGSIVFDGSTFNENSNFDNTGSRDEYFGNYQKERFADWPEPDAFQNISFEDVSFRGPVSFRNRIFRHRTSFKNCRFEVAPIFDGASLHPSTDLHGTKFLDTKSDHASSAYRWLKAQMATIHAKNDERFFFALEQRSLLNRYGSARELFVRQPSSGRPRVPHLILLVLYGWLGDFGRSLIRPCLWMLLLMPSAALLRQHMDDGVNTFREGILWAISSAFRPFFGLNSETDLDLLLLTVGHTFLQLTLVFMIAFGIRQRLGMR
ncbi:MAG: hypothetical protein AAF541_22890 [Pseudomonadota bacterium]